MVKPIRKNPNKNPPILSHEFVIQNHADIVSCIAMVFVIGLMIPTTAPLASLFIVLQNNVTEPEPGTHILYMPGVTDLCTVIFYSLICIVIHAIAQEYCLDKISKRLHLSKSKLSVFSQSGQLAIYYLFASVWGLDILIREGYILSPTLLWADYPAPLSAQHKLILLIQIAYSIHELPELYLQRVPQAQIFNSAITSVVSAVFVTTLYFLNLNRLLLWLLVLHYLSELISNLTQIVQIIDKEEKLSKATSLVSNVFLVLARLGSIVLAVLTLWFGLAQESSLPADTPGNYNIPPVRLGALIAIVSLQIYLMYNFITQQLEQARENNSNAAKTNLAAKVNKQRKEKKKAKNPKPKESDLPEVDQNTNKNLRQRPQQKAK